MIPLFEVQRAFMEFSGLSEEDCRPYLTMMTAAIRDITKRIRHGKCSADELALLAELAAALVYERCAAVQCCESGTVRAGEVQVTVDGAQSLRAAQELRKQLAVFASSILTDTDFLFASM